MLPLVLSILVIATFVLALGAWSLWRRGDRPKARLMALAAFVCAANVAIWTLPA